MPAITYSYTLEELAGHVVISDALMVDRRRLAKPDALWPAPIAKPGHFRPVTADDVRRGDHIAHLLTEYLASVRTIDPSALGADDPDDHLCNAADSLDDALACIREAVERAYGREAA